MVYAGVVSLTVRNSKSRVAKRKKAKDDLKSRMDKAAGILKNTDKSIAEVALAVGEKNSASFEKNFAKIYGAKPLEYRKNSGK